MIICAGVWLLLSLWLRLTPVVKALAVAEAKNAAAGAVSSVITELMSDGEMDLSGLVRLEKDEAGRITALTSDMARINMLRSEVTRRVIERAGGSAMTEISVPLGNLFGDGILSGRGPRIPIMAMSVSSVETDFINHFKSAGINQTRHRIVAAVEMSMDIITPSGSVHTTVSTHMTVADTVIVGQVPESFTYFEGDEQWDEGLERYDITT